MSDIPFLTARLIFRGSDKNDGLIIGATFNGQTFFKPNTVYAVTNCDGALNVTPVGVVNQGVNWGQDISTILSNNGKYLWLTQEEWLYEARKRGRSRR